MPFSRRTKSAFRLPSIMRPSRRTSQDDSELNLSFSSNSNAGTKKHAQRRSYFDIGDHKERESAIMSRLRVEGMDADWLDYEDWPSSEDENGAPRLFAQSTIDRPQVQGNAIEDGTLSKDNYLNWSHHSLPELLEPVDDDLKLPVSDAFQELCETEASFSRKMSLVQLFFVKGLEAYLQVPGEVPLLSEEDIHLVFMNIEEIEGLSSNLAEAFRNVDMCEHLSCCKIGKIIINNSKKIYETFKHYCYKFAWAYKYLKHLRATNPRFNSFIRRQEFVTGTVLDSLLIEPVQRILRYQLLVDCVISKKSCGDDCFLIKAKDALQGISKRIEKGACEFAGMFMVRVLQEKVFDNKCTLVTKERVCLRCGTLLKSTPKSMYSTRKYLFMLFNDSLCYAYDSYEKDKADFRRAIPLAFMSIEDLEDTSTTKYAFRIRSNVKSFVLMALDAKMKADWMGDLNKALKSFKHSLKSPRDAVKMGFEMEMEITKAPSNHERSKLISQLEMSDLWIE